MMKQNHINFFDKFFYSQDPLHELPLLPTLSSYAGPMPRLVVPILSVFFASSLIPSNSLCKGKINIAFSAIYKFLFVILIPNFFYLFNFF